METTTIDNVMQQAEAAFGAFMQTTLAQRAHFLCCIADELMQAKAALLAVAHAETHLAIPRLESELIRACFQLTSYAAACEKGDWLCARIDNAQPPKWDIRKINIPLGPVVVFGASNFPFAYGTAGGDTACALAAGCSVVVKGHPAHPHTSTLIANAIQSAVARCDLPAHTFQHVTFAEISAGIQLVQHTLTQAVGFTGSFQGGNALWKAAQERVTPIPVFAEMGSVNPVFLLPEQLQQFTESLAHQLTDSLTQSVGQFCTNPGIMVGINSPALTAFSLKMKALIEAVLPENMLHEGIATAFHRLRRNAISQQNVKVLGTSKHPANDLQAIPTVLEVAAADFLRNPLLHEEVFGPYSVLVVCENADEMQKVAQVLHGQLTCTVIGSQTDLQIFSSLIAILQRKCGRFILNGVPTGVQVCLSMQHGGPYPATTDSRFTAVGADGILRFVRPLAFQNCPNALLPPALQDENPWHIPRTINNVYHAT